MSLHRVARVADVPEDRGLQVEIGERKIVLLHAMANCAHFKANAHMPGRHWLTARCATDA